MFISSCLLLFCGIQCANSFNGNWRDHSKDDLLRSEIQNGLHSGLRFFKHSDSQRTKYVIIASGLLVPGSVYRIIVNLLESGEPVNVNASISRASDGFQIGSEELTVAPQSSELIRIKVGFRDLEVESFKLFIETDFHLVMFII